MEIRSRKMTCLRKATTCLIAMLALSIATGAQVSAATLATWSFSGSSGYGPSPFSPTSTPTPNATVGGLTRGPGVDLGGTPAGSGWGGRAWDFNADPGDFASFTVKASPGYELSLSGIDPYNVRRSGTGPTTGQWQYSLDGSNFSNIGSPITWGGVTTATGNPQTGVNLSGISALQSVPDTTTVTLRVINFGGAATGTWYFNSAGSAPTTFSLQGSVAQAIPEPSSIAIASLGLMGATAFKRRRSPAGRAKL